MSDILTPCIRKIFEARDDSDDKIKDPLFQVVEIKEIAKDGNQRFKLAISDGVNYCPAMLNSQLSYLITNNELEKFQIIKVKDCTCVKQKKLLIIIELDVLPQKYTEIIGDPQGLNLREDPSRQRDETPNAAARIEPKSMTAVPKKPITAPPPPPKVKPARQPSSAQYFSIASLTSYIPDWTILARIVQKSSIKEWHKTNSNGKLFNIVLKDKQGDEIRGTFYNDAVDAFFDTIELDKVYVIHGGRVKNANKKFSGNIGHDYEITFDKNSTFTECTDSEQDQIGEISYNFTHLKDLEKEEVNKIVDILAVVSSVQQTEEVHSNKMNKPLTKRTIVLTDNSNATIECTLWNEDAINFPMSAADQVLRIKDARVGEYHGKNLGTTSTSIIKLLPRSDPDAAPLYQWYDENKENVDSFEKISSGFGGSGDYSGKMIYLEQINTNNLGRNERPDNFCAYVSLKDISQNRNLYYLACPNPDCKNKGVSLEGDKYICNSCKQAVDEPVPRFAFTANFGDFTGSGYFNILGDENGKNILDVTASEWKEQTDNLEESDRQKIIKPYLFKEFKLRGRAKNEPYNSEDRVKLYVTSITEIDYADAAKFFGDEIEKFN